METKLLDAANAYGAALNRAGGAGLDNGDAIGAAGAGKSGFGSLVNGLVAQTESAVAGAETAGIQAVAGQADLVDVVTAVSNAEMVLETVTTVRDRVISAYQEIMRMPI